MTLIRPLLVPFALCAAIALASGSAAAAPTVATVNGSTEVVLSADFVGALTTLGVAPSPAAPGRISAAGIATFPIAGGEIDADSLRGEINHNGGINLTAGELVVSLSSFVIDTTGETPVLTGLVKANGSVVGRIALFDLTLTAAPTIGPAPGISNLQAFDGRLALGGVGATLTAEAAAALNDVFDVTAFAAGLPIGTAAVQTLFRDTAD